MSNDEAFIRGLLDDPDDDSLRLVYADWLEERGDIRSDLLRVAVALRKATPDHRLFFTLRRRIQELRPLVPVSWLVKVLRTIAEDDVRQAVFRRMLGDEVSGWAFLRVEHGHDPSWYLLDCLAADYRDHVREGRLRPTSAADGPSRARSGVYDRETGERGTRFQIDSLKWISEDHCEVQGGYYFDGLAAAGNTYQVMLQEERWKVVEARMNWIA
jgi:uncharacterized protein (TIGR02996 family)